MNIGMLWFDNDKQADLKTKVNRAVTYYQQKYGQKPDLCFVNPCMINGNNQSQPASENSKTSGIEIRELSTLLPNHFWIGINQQKTEMATS